MKACLFFWNNFGLDKQSNLFYYFISHLFNSLVTTHKNPEGTCVQNKVNFNFICILFLFSVSGNETWA